MGCCVFKGGFVSEKQRKYGYLSDCAIGLLNSLLRKKSPKKICP
jgi:hypothetical protein